MDGSFYFSAKFPCFGNGKVVCNASISFLRSDCTPCQFPPSWLCHTFHEIVSLLIANWWHRPQPGGFFPVFAWDIWRCIGRLWDIWRCTGHSCKYKVSRWKWQTFCWRWWGSTRSRRASSSTASRRASSRPGYDSDNNNWADQDISIIVTCQRLLQFGAKSRLDGWVDLWVGWNTEHLWC